MPLFETLRAAHAAEDARKAEEAREAARRAAHRSQSYYGDCCGGLLDHAGYYCSSGATVPWSTPTFPVRSEKEES